MRRTHRGPRGKKRASLPGRPPILYPPPVAKQRSPSYLPWNPGLPDPLGGFPGLLNAHAYRAIHRFLTTEEAVRAILDAVAAETAGAGPGAFKAWLAAQEARFGFSPQVVTIDPGTLVKASLFWLWLINRRPLHDLGAGEFHGVSTHRLQWVLVGRWNAGSRLLGGDAAVAGFYAGLAHANARAFKAEWAEMLKSPLAAPIDTGRANPFVSTWDALFDAGFVGNATSPEYFCATFLATRYPALHGLVRQ